jgi:hypothetical protein
VAPFQKKQIDAVDDDHGRCWWVTSRALSRIRDWREIRGVTQLFKFNLEVFVLCSPM